MSAIIWAVILLLLIDHAVLHSQVERLEKKLAAREERTK